MRTPSFAKLIPGMAVACLCACGPQEPALQVTVAIDKDVAATCVVLELSAGGTVRVTQDLKRPKGKDSFVIGVKKLQLPNELKVVARSYTATSGAGCGEPRAQTSVSAVVDAAFPKAGATKVAVAIHAPPADLDADRDGRIAIGKGGDDCNDNDKDVFPGNPAACGSTVDNDCDGKVGCADSECASALQCTVPPAELAYVTTAMPVAVNACSPALTVELRDANHLPVLAASATAVAIGVVPTGGVALFADANCATPATQVTVPAGQSRASFHFKAMSMGMFEASATVGALATILQTQTVVLPPVAQLAFVNAPVTVQAGNCGGPFELQTRDSTGAVAVLTAGGSIALSSNQSGVAFFSDANCTMGATSVAVLAGGNGGTFYVKPTSVQSTTLTATLTGIPAATQLLTVTAGMATKLAFATPAQGVQTGACSNVVTVESRDALDNPAPATGDVTIAATGIAVSLFSDSNCTVPLVGPLPLTASFHFKGSVVGMATLTATAAGLTQAVQVESVGVGPVAKLAFSAPQTVTAGQCSAAASVEAQDMNGSPSNVSGMPLAVTLSGPAMGFTFFSDSGCMTPVAAPLTIPVGNTRANFYFIGTASGVQAITGSATGLSPANGTELINAAPPSTLIFTSPVQTQAVNTCAQFDLEARDAFGNPSAPASAVSVALTSTPAVSFSALAGCGSTATSVTLSGATVSFFIRTTVAGTRALTATAPFAAAMQTYTVTPGAASKLGFTTEPTNTVAGSAFTVAVAVQDSFGNTIASSTAPIALAIGTNPSTGTLSGTATVNAVASVATFSGLSINRSGTGYTVVATSSGLTAGTSAAFNIAAGPAAVLAFTVQPSNTVAAAAIAPPVQVTIRDALGNTVAATSNVTLTIGNNPSGGTLSGTTTVAAVAGVATFPGLSINRSGTGYTLSAAVGSTLTATSSGFDIAAGAPAVLAFTVQPSGAVAGASIVPSVQVSIRDSSGNLTASTANVTLAIGTPVPGAVLSGTTTVAAVAGVATFAGLSINRIGSFTLAATSSGLTSATSAAFTITAGPATQLVFVTQPTSTVAGAAIDPAPRVEIQDALGNRVNSTAGVKLDIGTNPGTGVFSGTLTVSAVAGVATFTGLSINRTGTGYTLAATSGALTQATSTVFNITVGPPAALAFTVQPTGAVSTVAMTPAVQVSVVDSQGNVVTTSTVSIQLTLPSGTGTLSGTATASAVAGVATFAGLSVDKVGTYMLNASAGALAGTSNSFTITAGPASKLVILGTPLTLPALNCSAARVVELQDAGGNPVPAAAAIALTYSAAPGSATTTFYSDAACSTLSMPATRTIAMGTSQTTFYFLAQNATPLVTLTATNGASLTDATQTAVIAQATPVKLAFTTPQPIIEAGFCQVLTLQRQDSADRPTSPTFATTVSLNTAALTGMSFFTDAGCTVGLAASFDILSGASTTVIYAKGITTNLLGTVPQSRTFGVTASAAGVTDGAINVGVLPMVRRGTCTIAAGQTATQACTVTPAIPGNNITRTFLLFQASGAAGNPANDNIVCRLNAGAGVEVLCERVGNATQVTVSWQTVSHAYSFAAGGATVEHQSSLFSSATTNPLVFNVPSVDPTKSFVLFSSGTSGADNRVNDFMTARLSTATNVTVQQTGGANFGTAGRFSIQVVSLAGSAVVRGSETAAIGATTVPVTGLTPSVVARTFPIFSARNSTTQDNDVICKRKLRGVVATSAALAFTRGDGAAGNCVDSEIAELAWERVELPAGNTVQSANVLHANNADTGSASITAVDLTRSVVFMAGQGMGGQAAGESNFAANDIIGAVVGTATFNTAGNQVTVTRPAANLGTATFTPFVVQFAP